MDKEVIIRKIKSLLTITEKGSGASDNEVQVAMTKARELMAKYNITMSEAQGGDGTSPLNVEGTSITYTTRYSVWKLPLAMMLAKYHRCSVVSRRVYRKQSREIRFVGEGENPAILCELFKSLVPFLEMKIYAIHDKYYDEPADRRYMISDSYVQGFISGLGDHYDSQTEKDPIGMSLMVTTPQSVKDYLKTLTNIKVDTSPRGILPSQFNEGYAEGFMHMKEKIEG